MSAPEVIAAFGVPLLTLLLAVVSIIYRNDQKAAERYQADQARIRAEDLARTIALEKQNTEQETRIATLTANMSHAGEVDTRLAVAIDKLDNKLDVLIDVMRDLTRRLTGSSFPASKMGPPRGG